MNLSTYQSEHSSQDVLSPRSFPSAPDDLQVFLADVPLWFLGLLPVSSSWPNSSVGSSACHVHQGRDHLAKQVIFQLLACHSHVNNAEAALCFVVF